MKVADAVNGAGPVDRLGVSRHRENSAARTTVQFGVARRIGGASFAAIAPTDSLERSTPASLDRTASAITPTSWSAGGELAVSEWVEQGRWLGAIGRASAWWIGDWIRYGSARYGDKYLSASHVTGYDVQSLMNMAYVASRFDEARRRPGLSFSHHAELAGLAPEDQELWLDRAEAGGMSVHKLRAELRRVRERSAARLTLHAAPALDDDALECPQCGHRFTR